MVWYGLLRYRPGYICTVCKVSLALYVQWLGAVCDKISSQKDVLFGIANPTRPLNLYYLAQPFASSTSVQVVSHMSQWPKLPHIRVGNGDGHLPDEPASA